MIKQTLVCSTRSTTILTDGPFSSFSLIFKRFKIYFTNSYTGWTINIIQLRGSLPKSGPLDFATKNTFPLFFVGEEALVGIY